MLTFFWMLCLAQTPDKNLTFDAASIKPAPIQNGRMVFSRGGRGGPGSSDPGRIHYPMINLKSLLVNAYGVKDFQISGPSWLDTERFEVQATMPPETTKEQLQIMLQNLLAERFKLTVHRETKDFQMYSLIVGKSGPKLKESGPPPEQKEEDDKPIALPPPGQLKMDADGFPILPNINGAKGGMFQIMMPSRARITAQQQTMHDLADRLTQMLSRPVSDATGLTAKFDFTLTYLPEGMSGPMGMMPPPPPPPPGGEGERKALAAREDIPPPPDIMTAVQSQLGLKLDPKKGPVELIVIDHMEKTPTEN